MKNISSKYLSLVGGLALASGAAHAQVATNLLSETTFDAAAASPWGYGYLYGNNGLGAQTHNRQYFLPADVDMTNALFQFTFDATDLVGVVNWGAGTGAPLFKTEPDPAAYVSGDRTDYILTFDARVEGLDVAHPTANAEMQAQFYYPNPEGGDPLKSLQVNLPFQPMAEWKTFRFTLDQGTVGGDTAESDFLAHHFETSDLRFNVNLHEPFMSFGNDADNALYLDNVKLEVVNRPTTTPTPTYRVAAVDWNMDDKGVWYEFNFDWSQNDNHLIRTGSNNANNSAPNILGVAASSAWFLQIDNTSFADNTPQYAGAGTGGGGPVDYTKFDSGDLTKYVITFDARAAGLAEGRANTTVALQLFLDAPDDTVQPVDADANADRVVQLNFPVKVTPEFQHFSFALNKGGVGSGSAENFANHFSVLSDLRTQWQIENAASLADWGYDADNALIIDNIKVERIFEGLAPITFSVEGNQLVLNWAGTSEGTVKLQSSSTVNGTFADVTDVTGATYRADMTGTERYFRLVWLQP